MKLGFVLLFMFFIGCVTTNIPSLSDQTFLSFGSLGGFAGSYTEYRIFPDGRAYSKSNYNEMFVELQLLDKGLTAQIFSLVENFKKEGLSINDPDNLSYFLSWSKKGNNVYELVWGGPVKTDKRILSLYKLITDICEEKVYTR